MASSGAMKGDLIYITIGGTKISNLITDSWNETKEGIEVTSKDSSNRKEFIYGDGDGTASASAIFDEAAAWGKTEAYTAMDAGTNLTMRRTSGVSGDEYREVSALITSISETHEHAGRAEVSFDFQMTGSVTTGTEA